ncbi:MAG: DUF192 domain-containing protein [Beijerinckiaceae bacterium]|nr:DUF192 domain-containing protein [Beijerinckiaceae bacterium]
MPDAHSTDRSAATSTTSTRSRRFVVFFVAALALSLVVSLTTNILRRPETEAVAANAAAGQRILADAATTATKAAEVKPFEPLEIVTASGKHRLDVEVMRTPDEQARGLMFRQSMADSNGMLFDFGLDRPVSMWMKNTYIPLDMVFINADGTIHRVEERTEPLSERTIASGAPVRAVLELSAGVARKLGIKSGDKVVHAMFPAK